MNKDLAPERDSPWFSPSFFRGFSSLAPLAESMMEKGRAKEILIDPCRDSVRKAPR